MTTRKKLYFFLIFPVFMASCGLFQKQDPEDGAVARVGAAYLHKNELAKMMGNSPQNKADSIAVATHLINTWAAKQLLLDKAKINLPEEKLAEFEALVAEYRMDLYTRAYLEALVDQHPDTLLSEEAIAGYYQKEQNHFVLKEKLLKLRFVFLPEDFQDQEAVATSLKRFQASDKAYLDSLSVHFKKYNFNDSIWVQSVKVFQEIPVLGPDEAEKYLKNSQFFELKDSLGVYLGQVTEVLEVNDMAPLEFVRPTIQQVLRNRKKMDKSRSIETELIDEAVKNKEFEIYGQDR
ncbi:peptidylprolyl isomerase [Sediminicola luteus]|uniref:Peptidylprolyl isomerase n=1 Tax=Sediminicola luteus TaxID=319238 RepID=A0A2A4G6E5_9FLAO|nr:peptidylprolyl isomerase [Sediminicola luteus]PCE63558.1 peptidylprolyl isomerase [Sediminicola luteus]